MLLSLPDHLIWCDRALRILEYGKMEMFVDKPAAFVSCLLSHGLHALENLTSRRLGCSGRFYRQG